jgi:sec-independent protein translocase protein TatA
MGSLGPFEIILIFLVVLLIFGAKRIPEIARGLGKGIREFKDATNEIQRELNVNDTSNRIQPPQQQTTPRQQPQAPQAEPQEPARSDNPGSQEASQQQAS